MSKPLLLAGVASVIVSGCASHPLERTAYSALQQHECIERNGDPGCVTPGQSFDDYATARKAETK